MRRIDEAAKYCSIDRLALTSQCRVPGGGRSRRCPPRLRYPMAQARTDRRDRTPGLEILGRVNLQVPPARAA
jgi:hypothetical protein